VGVTHNVGELIERIQAQTAALAPGSPQLREAYTRIGLYVTALTKLNVRRQGLIDTGRLINSIRYEFFKEGPIEGVQIGSFNVPYAAVHEFGYRGLQRIPAHPRTITQAFGRPINPTTVTVRDHSRQVNIRMRPFLRPAITTSRLFIIDTLRAATQYARGGK
jgi:phage gpG-like protein